MGRERMFIFSAILAMSLCPDSAQAFAGPGSAWLVHLPVQSNGHDWVFRMSVSTQSGETTDAAVGVCLKADGQSEQVCSATSQMLLVDDLNEEDESADEPVYVLDRDHLETLLSPLGVHLEVGLEFALFFEDTSGRFLREYYNDSPSVEQSISFVIGSAGEPNTPIDLGTIVLSCDATATDSLGKPVWAYSDSDGDGYGAPETCVYAPSEELPTGLTRNSQDCDDGDPGTHPLALEITDFKDVNCDGLADTRQGQWVVDTLRAGPWSMVCADFNQDGAQECALTSMLNGQVIILHTMVKPIPTDGRRRDEPNLRSMHVVQEIFVGSAPATIVSSDVNSDGFPDLIVTVRNLGLIKILLNDGTGFFDDSQTIDLYHDAVNPMISYILLMADIIPVDPSTCPSLSEGQVCPNQGEEIVVLGYKTVGQTSQYTASLSVLGNQGGANSGNYQVVQRVTDGQLNSLGITGLNDLKGGLWLTSMDTDHDGHVDYIISGTDFDGSTISGAAYRGGVIAFRVGDNGLWCKDQQGKSELCGVQILGNRGGTYLDSLSVAIFDPAIGPQLVIGWHLGGLEVLTPPRSAQQDWSRDSSYTQTSPATANVVALWTGDLVPGGSTETIYVTTTGGLTIYSELRMISKVNATWQDSRISTLNGAPKDLQVVDLDGDGDRDIVTGYTYGQRLQIFEAMGRGRFNWSGAKRDRDIIGDPSILRRLSAIHQMDINGDGWMDIVGIVNRGQSPVSFLNNEGVLAAPNMISVPSQFIATPLSVQSGDIDQDTCEDLAITQSNGTVLIGLNHKIENLNEGEPTCTGIFDWTSLTVGPLPYGLVLEDLDGNGTLDLVSTQDPGSTEGSIQILWDLHVASATSSPRTVTWSSTQSRKLGDSTPRGLTSVPWATGRGRDLVVVTNGQKWVTRWRVQPSTEPVSIGRVTMALAADDLTYWPKKEMVVAVHGAGLTFVNLVDNPTEGLALSSGNSNKLTSHYTKSVAPITMADGIPRLLVTNVDGAAMLAEQRDDGTWVYTGARGLGGDAAVCIPFQLKQSGPADIACSGYYAGQLILLEWEESLRSQ